MLYRRFDRDVIYNKFVHRKCKNFGEWWDAARLATEALKLWKNTHPGPQKEGSPVESDYLASAAFDATGEPR